MAKVLVLTETKNRSKEAGANRCHSRTLLTQNEELGVEEEILDDSPVALVESGVVVSNGVAGDELAKLDISNVCGLALQRHMLLMARDVTSLV